MKRSAAIFSTYAVDKNFELRKEYLLQSNFRFWKANFGKITYLTTSYHFFAMGEFVLPMLLLRKLSKFWLFCLEKWHQESIFVQFLSFSGILDYVPAKFFFAIWSDAKQKRVWEADTSQKLW